MSPASKSKDKSAVRAAKEQMKASSKPSTPANPGSDIPANACYPLLGTFHTLETALIVSSPPPHSNGRLRNMDQTDEQSGSSLGSGAEYDSVSNNDSCSGESEDQKEKVASTPVQQEAIPGAGNDKRDKIRQKNERKHQRQRERRAQDLHERCSGYLMSRKLEALAQQLVAMGFSSERATMALILNEGKVEESVAWLFEAGDEATQQNDSNFDGGNNLKIDIAEELARIAEMETGFKCSRQEVERVVVACEGDLDKAAETLHAQKQEPPAAPPKPEETGDLPVLNDGKVAISVTQSQVRPQAKHASSVTIQQKRDERDLNYTKAADTVVVSPESVNRNLQSLKSIQPKAEWARSQVTTPAKQWPSGGTSPSASYSLESPLKVTTQVETEARYVVVGSEVENLQTGGVVRAPVIMMQRPQSIIAKQNLVTGVSASPPVTAGWYPNGATGVKFMKSNGGLTQIPSTSLSPSSLSSQQFQPQSNHQPFVSSPVEYPATGWGRSWGTAGTSSSLAVPSSLGLFSGWGSNVASGSSSLVDWNTGGSIPQCDYTNIDWTLESSSNSRPNGLWLGLASFVKNSQMYDSWSPSTSVGTRPAIRSVGANGFCIAGLQEGAVVADTSSAGSSVGSHEWTSPFAGKDLFSLPRQFGTFPSL